MYSATTSAVDDAVVTRVKGYIDAGTCEVPACSGVTGDNAVSYYKEIEYNGMRVIISNQVGKVGFRAGLVNCSKKDD